MAVLASMTALKGGGAPVMARTVITLDSTSARHTRTGPPDGKQISKHLFGNEFPRMHRKKRKRTVELIKVP